MSKTRSMAVLAAALLAGCGGGSDDAPGAGAADPLAAVPAAASQSADGLNAYLRSLAAAPAADQAEPAPLTDFAPPLPEDAEPEPLG